GGVLPLGVVGGDGVGHPQLVVPHAVQAVASQDAGHAVARLGGLIDGLPGVGVHLREQSIVEVGDGLGAVEAREHRQDVGIAHAVLDALLHGVVCGSDLGGHGLQGRSGIGGGDDLGGDFLNFLLVAGFGGGVGLG